MPQAKQEDAQVVSDVVDTPEQALAAQQEGFAEAVSSTPAPSKTEKSAEQITQEVEAAAKLEKEASEQAKSAQAKMPILAGYTDEEVKSALDKAKQYDSLKTALDKVNGKFGGREKTNSKRTNEAFILRFFNRLSVASQVGLSLLQCAGDVNN